MADLATLQMALEASRRFSVSVEKRTFTLRMPTEYDWRVAAEDNRDVHGNVKDAQMFAPLMLQCVVGWEGVTAADIAPGAGADPLPFSETARALLLANNMEIADTIAIAMTQRMREQRSAREAALKNSSGAPSGT